MKRHELSAQQWELLAPFFPPPRRKPGGQWKDDRTMLDGIFWRLNTGAPCRDLPDRFGPWQTVYDRFNKMRTSNEKPTLWTVPGQRQTSRLLTAWPPATWSGGAGWRPSHARGDRRPGLPARPCRPVAPLPARPPHLAPVHAARPGAAVSPRLKPAFGPPRLGSRLARARNRVAPMPHACEQARQTLAGLLRQVGPADTKPAP